MYAEKLHRFENIENLGGKAWEHAIACDVISQTPVKDCSLHCFHYQQMFELLLKHLLEAQTKYGAYPRTHKLDKLLLQVIDEAGFNPESAKYIDTLNAITVCAEVYRYNFLLDCKTYQRSVDILDPLLFELAEFAKN
jgi:hypothetical protein